LFPGNWLEPGGTATPATCPRRPTPSPYCWNILRNSRRPSKATLVPGIKGEGIEFACTEGRLPIDRAHYEFHSTEKGAQPVVVKAAANLDLDRIRNFLDCVRSRALPNGDVLIGHRSA
jgi:hypothetical protein